MASRLVTRKRAFIADADATLALNASAVSGNVRVWTQDIPLTELNAAGAVLAADFNFGTVMPAGSLVFPSTAEIQVVQPFGAAVAHTLVGAAAIIRGGHYPTPGDFVTVPSHSADCLDIRGNVYWGGGQNANADVGGLSMTQDGQQLYVRIALTGTTTFDILPTGHLVARILYIT